MMVKCVLNLQNYRKTQRESNSMWLFIATWPNPSYRSSWQLWSIDIHLEMDGFFSVVAQLLTTWDSESSVLPQPVEMPHLTLVVQELFQMFLQTCPTFSELFTLIIIIQPRTNTGTLNSSLSITFVAVSCCCHSYTDSWCLRSNGR